MSSRTALTMALLAALAMACSQSARREDTGRVEQAASLLESATSCAAQLDEVLQVDVQQGDVDTQEVGRALRVQPARLAAFGESERAIRELRDAVRERLDEAQENAAAARSLASLGVDGSAELAAMALDRADLSLAASRTLCRAAGDLRARVVATWGP